jgi:hypothetical protein
MKDNSENWINAFYFANCVLADAILSELILTI